MDQIGSAQFDSVFLRLSDYLENEIRGFIYDQSAGEKNWNCLTVRNPMVRRRYDKDLGLRKSEFQIRF